MTKRSVERDIEDLNEEVLEELSPEVRLELWLEAAAVGNETWLEQLRDTAPVKDYWSTDLAFVERGRGAVRLANQVVYDLHTTALQCEILDQQQRLWWLIDLYADEEPSEADLDRAKKRADGIKTLYFELYTCYHAWQQFATDVLGVDFDTWMALHPDGAGVGELVEEVLASEEYYDLAEEYFNTEITPSLTGEEPTAPGDDGWYTLDELADYRVQSCEELWDDIVAQAPG